jgi:lipid-A-disaccharide synthase-like uncharacterized protein
MGKGINAMKNAFMAVYRVAELWAALAWLALGYVISVKFIGRSWNESWSELRSMAPTAFWIMKRVSVGIGLTSWIVGHWRDANE